MPQFPSQPMSAFGPWQTLCYSQKQHPIGLDAVEHDVLSGLPHPRELLAPGFVPLLPLQLGRAHQSKARHVGPRRGRQPLPARFDDRQCLFVSLRIRAPQRGEARARFRPRETDLRQLPAIEKLDAGKFAEPLDFLCLKRRAAEGVAANAPRVVG